MEYGRSRWVYISIYTADEPDVINELINTPEMQRLSGVGMHCGCEYTSLTRYMREKHPYSRLTHSIGVSRIIRHFTKDIKQTVAGLLHDVATPVFAHTIDFMNNDHITQESTEDGTRSFINNSANIMALLDKHHIKPEDVSDYHVYPIADNDTPMLSADRLDYTLGNGYLVSGYSLREVRDMYDDLIIAENELGVPELCFQSVDVVKAFSNMAMINSRLYVSDEDRFAMQKLAEIIRNAIRSGVLTPDDLYTTESEVIAKLKNDRELSAAWDSYTRISSVSISPGVLCDRYCVNVSAKKRYIDPLVMTENGAKRISKIDAEIKRDIAAFLDMDFNYWIYADENGYRPAPRTVN